MSDGNVEVKAKLSLPKIKKAKAAKVTPISLSVKINDPKSSSDKNGSASFKCKLPLNLSLSISAKAQNKCRIFSSIKGLKLSSSAYVAKKSGIKSVIKGLELSCNAYAREKDNDKNHIKSRIAGIALRSNAESLQSNQGYVHIKSSISLNIESKIESPKYTYQDILDFIDIEKIRSEIQNQISESIIISSDVKADFYCLISLQLSSSASLSNKLKNGFADFESSLTLKFECDAYMVESGYFDAVIPPLKLNSVIKNV